MLGIGGTCLFLVTQSEPVFLVPLLLLVATGWALFLVVGGPNRSTRIDPFHVAGTMAALALLITGALIAIDYGGSLLGQVALVCGYAGVGVVAVWGSPRWSGRAFLALLLVHVVVALVDFHSYDPRIDVQPFLEGGIDALWSGSSPYGITIPNVFDAADTAKFYGPGIVDQGRVLIGYPYLPSPCCWTPWLTSWARCGSCTWPRCSGQPRSSGTWPRTGRAGRSRCSWWPPRSPGRLSTTSGWSW